MTTPSDTMWLKSTCLTPSLSSSITTSTMEEVSPKGRGGERVDPHTGTWFLRVKRADLKKSLDAQLEKDANSWVILPVSLQPILHTCAADFSARVGSRCPGFGTCFPE